MSTITFPGANDLNRCSAIKGDGIRCGRDKDKNNQLCRLHQGAIAAKTGKGGSRFSPLYGNTSKWFHVGEQELKIGDVKDSPFWIKPGFKAPLTYNQNYEYVVLMIDPDRNKGTQYLHWLVVNFNRFYDDPNIHTIIPYEAPSPCPPTGLHRYIFYLLVQSQHMSPAEIQTLQNTYNSSRDTFNIHDFLKKFNLTSKGCTHFTIMM